MTKEIEGCTYNGLYVPCEFCELNDKPSECIEMREMVNVRVKYKDAEAT